MTTILLFLTLAFAQGPKPAENPSPPEKIEIKGEDYDRLKIAELEAQVAALRAENFALQIERAQHELADLQSKARTAATAYNGRLSSTSKIPFNDLTKYSPTDQNGTLTLTRKPQ